MKKMTFSMITALALSAFIATGDANASETKHIVKRGDTLWNIATKYNLTVNELKAFNRLDSDNIQIDQVLTISISAVSNKKPVPAIEYKTIVHAGKKSKFPLSIPVVEEEIIMKDEPIASATSILQNAVEVALPLQGTPYVWAGTTIEGFDCSGFISYVFNNAGLTIGRSDTMGLFNQSSTVVEPVKGDLVFFENTYRIGISHAGIYLGDGNFIHAGSKQVEIASLETPYWKDKFLGFKRFNSLQ